MRTLQQIFDLMIKEGYYSGIGSRYMCHAIWQAMRDGIISIDEWAKAKRAINGYLIANNWVTVRGAIGKWGKEFCPNINEHTLADLMHHGAMEIYKDWKRRPRKTRGSYEACMRHRVARWIADIRRQQNDQS